MVVEDKNEKASFQVLQNYIKTRKGNLNYYVFNILNLNGNSTDKLSLIERKELLKIVIYKQKLSNLF